MSTDDRHKPGIPGFPGIDRYRKGGFWRADDLDSARRRNYDTFKEWNGAIVGRDNFEPRQPLDFLKGIPDVQTVPDARPPSEVFTGPFFTLMAANALPGDDAILVEDVSGFLAGAFVAIMLDSGERFLPTVTSLSTPLLVTESGLDLVTLGGDFLIAQVMSSLVVNITPPLPGPASIGVEVISYVPIPPNIASL